MSKAGEDGVQALSVIVGRRLTSIVSNFDLRRSHSKQRETLWRSFYNFRSSELPKLWDDFTKRMNFESKYKDPWLIQTAARKMIESIIKCKLPTPQKTTQAQSLNPDEHNALRYAAGYVLHVIKKKETNPALQSWLAKQIDSSVSASTYYQFTKLWVEKVNRGGLYLVSDSLYEVFLAMELVLRQYLGHCPQDHGLKRDQVLEAMQEDSAVQFHWSHGLLLSCNTTAVFVRTDIFLEVFTFFGRPHLFTFIACLFLSSFLRVLPNFNFLLPMIVNVRYTA